MFGFPFAYTKIKVMGKIVHFLLPVCLIRVSVACCPFFIVSVCFNEVISSSCLSLRQYRGNNLQNSIQSSYIGKLSYLTSISEF